MHSKYSLSKQQLPKHNLLLTYCHKQHCACMTVKLYGEAWISHVIPHASAELTALPTYTAGSLEQAVPISIVDGVCTLHMHHVLACWHRLCASAHTADTHLFWISVELGYCSAST